MNSSSSEHLLQERLERLEEGDALEALLADMDPEDRELLALASTLREQQPGRMGETAVARQRAAVIGRAAAARTSHLGGWIDRFLVWFKEPFVLVGTAAAVALVLIFIGAIALGPRPEAAELAAVPPSTMAEEPAGDSAGPAEAQISPEAAAEVSSEPAVQTAVLPAHQLFLPIHLRPLVTTPGAGSAHRVKGLVEIQRSEGNWERVDEGAAIAAGDRLRTGTLSSVRVMFFDGSEAVLEPQTEMVFEVVDARRPADGFRTVVMLQARGRSWHAVDHRGDAGSRYEVKTAGVSGVARGTLFAVTSEAGREARYEVVEGRVDVSGAGRTVTVSAGQQSTIPDGSPPSAAAFTISGRGEVTAIDENLWTIAGQLFEVTAETVLIGDPNIGDTVEVSGHLASGGRRIADRVEKISRSAAVVTNQFSLVGVVDSRAPGRWVVQGQGVVISPTTRIEAGIEVGDTVRVHGQITAAGELVALEIALVRQETVFPFLFAGLVEAIDPWMVAGVELVVDADSDIEAGIAVGDAVKVKGVVQADGSWLVETISILTENQAAFAVTGELTGINPWSVAGLPFEVNEATQIAAGLALGETVLVRGRILANGIWLADSVERVQEGLLEIVFAGFVDEIDPWVVSGLPLQTDDNSLIEAGIEVDDLVRVTARIEGDGRWTIIRLELLSRASLVEGCLTVTAVVTGINAAEVFLSDGSSVSLDDLEIEGELRLGSVVLLVACVDEAGLITIERIIVIYNPPVQPPLPPVEGPVGGRQERVTICHKPGTPAEQTKSLPASALGGHLGHGDTMGPCP